MGESRVTNQSVAMDTFVMTDRGARQVHDLLGKASTLMVDGKPFSTSGRGFFRSARSTLLRVETEEGFSVRLTGNHLILKVASSARSTVRAEWIETKNIKPGDRLLLHNHRYLGNWQGDFGEAEGYVAGLLLGEGPIKEDTSVISIRMPSCRERLAHSTAEEADPRGKPQPGSLVEAPHPDEMGVSFGRVKEMALRLSVLPQEKQITAALEKCSSDFYRAFLRGLFDCDGSAQGTQKKGISIRLSRRDVSFLEALQRMLLRLGIVGRISQERKNEEEIPAAQGEEESPSPARRRHELLITNNNVQYFDHLVGFANAHKQAHLTKLLTSYKRVLNRERFTATAKKITPEPDDDVCSVRVPGVNAFDANGFYVHSAG